MTIALWAIDGIALAIAIIALVTIALSWAGVSQATILEMIVDWLLEHASRILIILLIGAGLWYGLKRFLPPLVRSVMARPAEGQSKQEIKKRVNTLVGVFTGAGRIIIIAVIAFMVLSEIDIPIGPILAGFGIVGIAVGFGGQYLIRALIAGVFILLENQYRVGDVARVSGVAGLVEEITLRKTVLRDLDGIVHHVPNGEIKVASNFTRGFSRVNLNVSVAYRTDLDHAIEVINRVCRELAEDKNWSDRIINVPKVLRVDKFGELGIEIKILGDVKPIAQWDVMGELRLRLKKVFDAEGIEIPWTQAKIHFGNEPD